MAAREAPALVRPSTTPRRFAGGNSAFVLLNSLLDSHLQQHPGVSPGETRLREATGDVTANLQQHPGVSPGETARGGPFAPMSRIPSTTPRRFAGGNQLFAIDGKPMDPPSTTPRRFAGGNAPTFRRDSPSPSLQQHPGVSPGETGESDTAGAITYDLQQHPGVSPGETRCAACSSPPSATFNNTPAFRRGKPGILRDRDAAAPPSTTPRRFAGGNLLVGSELGPFLEPSTTPRRFAGGNRLVPVSLRTLPFRQQLRGLRPPPLPISRNPLIYLVLGRRATSPLARYEQTEAPSHARAQPERPRHRVAKPYRYMARRRCLARPRPPRRRTSLAARKSPVARYAPLLAALRTTVRAGPGVAGRPPQPTPGTPVAARVATRCRGSVATPRGPATSR